jgi:hypothetical protein
MVLNDATPVLDRIQGRIRAHPDALVVTIAIEGMGSSENRHRNGV